MSTFGWTSNSGEVDTTDQVRIELRFIEDLLVNESVEDWVVSSVGSAWDEDWLILEVEKIVREGYQDEQGNWVGAGPLYDAQFVRRRINWGADASIYLILIDLGVGLIGAATWDSFKALGKKMASRVRAARDGESHPLTEREAFERVGWILHERYKVDATLLCLAGIESSDEHMSIIVDDDQGIRYTCTLVVIDGLVDIARIRRELKG